MNPLIDIPPSRIKAVHPKGTYRIHGQPPQACLETTDGLIYGLGYFPRYRPAEYCRNGSGGRAYARLLAAAQRGLDRLRPISQA